MDILGLGLSAIDDTLYLSGEVVSDKKVRVQARERNIGGLTVGALIAAAKLGASCVFAGRLGTDHDSDWVAVALGRAGVVVRAPRVQHAGPVMSTVVVQPDGARTIFFDDSRVTGPSDSPDPALIDGTQRVAG